MVALELTIDNKSVITTQWSVSSGITPGTIVVQINNTPTHYAYNLSMNDFRGALSNAAKSNTPYINMAALEYREHHEHISKKQYNTLHHLVDTRG